MQRCYTSQLVATKSHLLDSLKEKWAGFYVMAKVHLESTIQSTIEDASINYLCLKILYVRLVNLTIY